MRCVMPKVRNAVRCGVRYNVAGIGSLHRIQHGHRCAYLFFSSKSSTVSILFYAIVILTLR